MQMQNVQLDGLGYLRKPKWQGWGWWGRGGGVTEWTASGIDTLIAFVGGFPPHVFLPLC